MRPLGKQMIGSILTTEAGLAESNPDDDEKTFLKLQQRRLVDHEGMLYPALLAFSQKSADPLLFAAFAVLYQLDRRIPALQLPYAEPKLPAEAHAVRSLPSSSNHSWVIFILCPLLLLSCQLGQRNWTSSRTDIRLYKRPKKTNKKGVNNIII